MRTSVRGNRYAVEAIQVFPGNDHVQQGICRDPRSVTERVQAYQEAGILFGLAETLAIDDAEIGLRIFLLDNSGSTAEADGHLLKSCGRSGYFESIPATRWEEICSMALDQAMWNSRLGVRCEFLLLNPPVPNDPLQGRDFVIIDPKMASVAGQVQNLQELLTKNGPRGVTPITKRLKTLQLRLQGGRGVPEDAQIMLCIVTDGLPTSDKSGQSTHEDRVAFVEQLRKFIQELNAFVVIRLCCDDREVIEFYDSVDQEMELPIDILDDLAGEGEELHKCGNGWLTYSPLIHRIREGGTRNKLFDLLDERALKPLEIAMLLDILLRREGDSRLPRTEDALLEAVEKRLLHAEPVYDGRLRKMAPPVDLKLLRRALKPKARICTIT